MIRFQRCSTRQTSCPKVSAREVISLLMPRLTAQQKVILSASLMGMGRVKLQLC